MDKSARAYEFDGFRLDPVKRLLWQDDQLVPLTPKALDTLLALVRHHGRIVEKDELMQIVWPDTIVEENNLTQHISALRKALGEHRREHKYIVTVPGRGYRFVAPITVGTEPDLAHTEPAVVNSDASMRAFTPVSNRRGKIWNHTSPRTGPTSSSFPIAPAIGRFGSVNVTVLILYGSPRSTARMSAVRDGRPITIRSCSSATGTVTPTSIQSMRTAACRAG
jgi:DNA-binding winged helix-turn-helix (wHTH) protein